MRSWDLDLDGEEGMRVTLLEAREAGHSRLFAIAYFPDEPVQWHHREDEAEMKSFLDSRDESESIMFSASVAIVVVNPQDSDETIDAILSGKQSRKENTSGFFSEAF